MKENLRLHLRKIREALSPQRRESASQLACTKLYQLTKSTKYLLSFASFGAEIDLWPLNILLANENRLVLPRIHDKDLHLFLVADIHQLVRHPWGMLEPIVNQCSPIEYSQIEIAFIPGLGFDLKTHYRLGYGKGFYDRLLPLITSAESWGVGFLEQAIDDLPYTSHDIPLEQIHLF